MHFVEIRGGVLREVRLDESAIGLSELTVHSTVLTIMGEKHAVANLDTGRTLVRGGRVLLVLATVAPFLPFAFAEGDGSAGGIARVAAGLAAAIVFGVTGAVAVSYGRRLQVPSGESIIADDGRPTVLFLRSFSADSVTMPGTDEAHATLPTAEEQLRDRLSGVGDMVAVGRPGEILPPIGAPRIYRDDGDWRAAVLDLMHRSCLTALAYGSSDGLAWELHQALERVPPERLLLWFPTRKVWHQFREFARTDSRWARGRPATAADVHLLAFYPDGTPRVLEVHWTTVVNDFSTDRYPDATEAGDVSPGGLEGYLKALPAPPAVPPFYGPFLR